MGLIRDLAENPHVHQPLSPGRELITDSDGRFALYLGAGRTARSATVQRVRLEPSDVVPVVEEIRAILQERGRGGAEWELGESCTPPDLVERLAALGILPDEDEPVAAGMVLEASTGVPARRQPATRPSSSPTPARCRARSSSGWDSRR